METMEQFNATNLTGRNVSLAIYQNTTNNTDDQCTMSVLQGTTIVVINSLFVPVGTFGNVLVIFAVLNTPQLRQRMSNFLLLSLAVADLLVTMIAQPFFLLEVYFHTFAMRCTPELELGYKIVGSLSCSSSVYHLAAISIDRALSTVKPYQHREIMKKWGVKTSLCICWGAAVVTNILYIHISSLGLLTFSPIFLCYSIIICSYGIIVYKITRKKPMRLALSVERERAMQRRVSGTIGIVIVLFTLFWSPFFGYFIWQNHYSIVDMKYSWIRTLYLSNSSMNFIVYSWRIHHFRVAYLRTIHTILQKVTSSLPERSTTKVIDTTNNLDGSANSSNPADVTLGSINDGNDPERIRLQKFPTTEN